MYLKPFILLGLTIGISLVVGTLIKVAIIRFAHDEMKWHRFVLFLDRLVDNPLTRLLFSLFIGRLLTRRAIKGYLRKGQFEKA
ncbi:MAG: hypothetical protein ACYS47_15160, partial [Planctomycetota bacterium]